MAVEGHDRAQGRPLGGQAAGLGQDVLVPEVDAVEHPDGHGRTLGRPGARPGLAHHLHRFDATRR
jgi:hypothetical protein